MREFVRDMGKGICESLLWAIRFFVRIPGIIHLLLYIILLCRETRFTLR